MHQEKAPQFRAVAAGEVVYSEGFAGNACIYVIAEGKIEISTKSDEKRVVLAIRGKTNASANARYCGPSRAERPLEP